MKRHMPYLPELKGPCVALQNHKADKTIRTDDTKNADEVDKNSAREPQMGQSNSSSITAVQSELVCI